MGAREERQSLSLSSLRVDGANAQVWQGERLLKLTPKAFAVLHYLYTHPGQLVTKEELMQTVWADTVVTDGALVACVRELRHTLNDDAQTPLYIETVHRRGYRFIGPVVSEQLSVVRREGREQEARSTEHGAEQNLFLTTPSTQHPAPLLVGRDAALTRLHQWLDTAVHGERQLVFITGEPGIGKTTLVEGFLNSLASRVQGQSKSRVQRLQPSLAPSPQPLAPGLGVAVGKGQCIEHYGASEAYLPVLEALGRLCRSAEGEHLIALLRHHAPTWLVQMPAVLAPSTLEVLQQSTQCATRDRMLRELVEALEVITAERPLILVLEDLHWSDPSTLDLLAMIARRTEPARLLIIGTYRPVDVIVHAHPLQTVTRELRLHGHCQDIALEFLSEAAIAEYLAARLAMPGGTHGGVSLLCLAHMLHQHTEGNPLFLTTMVDDLITRGVIVQTATGWNVREDGLRDEHIPDSIRQLVALQTARLASELQYTLEAASIAGLEFSAAAVAAARESETIDIERQCEQLAAQHLFLCRVGVEEWPDGTLAARYSFLHALYQQLWHERVSPTQLQHYHHRIGERKERAYGERAQEIATELALHFEHGRDFHTAVRYFQHAGEHAARRAAHQEAIALLTKGLALLAPLPLTQAGLQQELALQLTLSASLQELKGAAAQEVEHAYTRAFTLCQQMQETTARFPVLRGLCAVYQERGDFHTAYTLAEQLLAEAESSQAPDQRLWAHHAIGSILYSLGEFVPAHRHLATALAGYETQHQDADGVGPRPGVSCLYQLATLLWLLGYPTQALAHAHHALTLARALSHPYSIAMALSATAGIHRFRREEQSARAREDARDTLAQEHGFATWLTMGTFWQGWTLIEQGHNDDGIRHMQQGLTALHARGAELPRPGWLVLLAEAYGKIGQAEKGLQVLKEAVQIMERGGRRVYEAELYRLRGELTLQHARQNKHGTSDGRRATGSLSAHISRLTPLVSNEVAREAETHFLTAIAIAQKQHAKSWELRATTSLARLWQRQGKPKEAYQLLSDIYHWFTEGFDTRDLQEAKALLDYLAISSPSTTKGLLP